MKVLILASSGGDAHRRTLAAIIDDARRGGDDVRVLAPDAEGKLLRRLRVPVESWKPAGLFNVLRSIGALRRAVDYHAPDVIHAVGWTAAAVALGALPPSSAAKTVVTVLDPIREGEMPKAFIEKRMPELLQRAGCGTAAYTTLARELTERFGMDAERVSVIPPSVEPTHPEGLSRRAGTDGPIVGYLGRLDSDKAWENAIDALVLTKRAFPDARLWFEYTGPQRNLVKAYARGRGVEHEVTFFDDLPVGEFFTGVDMVVIPQSRDGLPYTLLQALVDGIPIVATNVEGLADTLRPYDTAWLVPEGAVGLAAGIQAAWPVIAVAWSGAQTQRADAARTHAPDAIAARYAAARSRVAVPVEPSPHP
jgi:glycosyltransferase involved in cell wall biosynthesis